MESSPQSLASKIEAAHQLYRDGKHEAALGFYTEALAAVKTKPQRIALHSNRAACYLKLHDFKKAAEECTSVLELDHDHTGALMLRAQTLVTLKDYHSALFDVNRLMELNPSSEAYQNLETRLRTQLSLAPIPESEAELEEEEEEEEDEDDESEAGEEYEDNEVVQTSKHELDRTTVYAEEGIKQPSSNGSGDQKPEARKSITAEVIAQVQRKPEPRRTIASEVIAQAQRTSKASAEQQQQQQSKGWQAIPKPKGHSALDYARWDRVVQDDSSDEDDDDDDDDDDEEESRPQYRFRVRTVGVQPVK